MATETARPVECSERSPRQLWQVPVFLLGVFALAAVPFLRPLWHDGPGRHLERQLEALRSGLKNPRGVAAQLLPLAVEALAESERLDQHVGEAHLLLGSLHLRLGGTNEEELAKARQHLEEAAALGVPEQDEPCLAYRLAVARYHTGAEPAQVIPALSGSLDAADDLGEAYALLTQAYLRLPTPDVPSALAVNFKHLQLPTANDDLLAPARLLRGELLLRLKEAVEARKVLARIGESAPPAILARARILLAQSHQDEGSWSEAAQLWEQALADRRQEPPARGRLVYNLGVCYSNLEKWPQAEKAWELTLLHGGEEAQAAALHVADVRLGGERRATALDLYEAGLRGVNQPSDYRNNLLSLEEARKLLEAGCRSFREEAEYEKAYRLVVLYLRIAQPPAGQVLLGEVAEAWAKALREESQQLGATQAGQLQAAAARGRFREAGAAFEAAADARVNQPDHAEWLFRSGDAYAQGECHLEAAKVLGRFVLLIAPPEQLGEAWFRLATAYRALGNEPSMSLALSTCVSYPGAAAFRARYEAAMLQEGKGKLDEAEEGLRHNLEQLQRAPDPVAHEKTLFALASLLYRRGKYGLAVEHLQKALENYPKNPQVLLARFQLAESYRSLAKEQYQNLLSGDRQSPDAEAHYKNQMHTWLSRAIPAFVEIEKDLKEQAGLRTLNPLEATVLFEAGFAIADGYYLDGDYEMAAQWYDRLATENVGRYDELVALQKLCSCRSIQGKIDQLLAALLRMRIALDGLPPRAFDGRPEEQSLAAWNRWHETLRQKVPNQIR